MWSGGKDSKNEGKYAYELFDMDGELVEEVGGFETYREMVKAAETAQRNLFLPFIKEMFSAPVQCDISDDDLLAELFA